MTDEMKIYGSNKEFTLLRDYHLGTDPFSLEEYREGKKKNSKTTGKIFTRKSYLFQIFHCLPGADDADAISIHENFCRTKPAVVIGT